MEEPMENADRLWNNFELNDLFVDYENGDDRGCEAALTGNSDFVMSGNLAGLMVNCLRGEILEHKITKVTLGFQEINRFFICFERDRSYIKIDADDDGVSIEKEIEISFGEIWSLTFSDIDALLEENAALFRKYRPDGSDPVNLGEENLEEEHPVIDTVPQQTQTPDSENDAQCIFSLSLKLNGIEYRWEACERDEEGEE